MKTSQNWVFIAISTAILMGTTGCQSARVNTHQTADTRNPAAVPIPAEDSVISRFVKSLLERSSMDEAGIEEAIGKASDRDFGDIKKLSEADQKKLIDQLLDSPGFAERVAVRDLNAVAAARAEAIASATGIKPVAGSEPVPSIHGGFVPNTGSAATNETFTFSKLLARNPEMKADIELMAKQDSLIQSSTGVGVLGSGCDSVQNEEAFENLSNIMNGVQRDVASGAAKDAKTVAKSLEKNMSDVLGTDAAESHRRVCTLSEKGGCGIFNLSICIP